MKETLDQSVRDTQLPRGPREDARRALEEGVSGGSKSRTNRGAGWRAIEWRLARDTADGVRGERSIGQGRFAAAFGEGRGRGRGGLDGEGLSLCSCRSLLSSELQFLKSGRWEQAKGIIDSGWA